MADSILTLNGGLLSLKFALFSPGDPPARFFSGRIERIGQSDSTLILGDGETAIAPQPVPARDLAAAAKTLFDVLDKRHRPGSRAPWGTELFMAARGSSPRSRSPRPCSTNCAGSPR